MNDVQQQVKIHVGKKIARMERQKSVLVDALNLIGKSNLPKPAMKQLAIDAIAAAERVKL